MRFWTSLGLFVFLITSCAPLSSQKEQGDLLAYLPPEGAHNLLSQHFPVFVVEKQNKPYNKIGSPEAELTSEGDLRVYVNSTEGTVYAEKRHFETRNASYINLIYRIHFSETPFGLIPFQISAGKNVGLFIIVTLNKKEQPVLYTLVHTCGCYLAFIPTTFLSKETFPPDWPEMKQTIYGETLPSLLDLKNDQEKTTLMVLVKNASHRVKDVWLANDSELRAYRFENVKLEPLQSLAELPIVGKDDTTSFYEETGSRKGYVKMSTKPFERLLISWWAFDWRVGEDKKLGQNKTDPPIFYTSLKPWARNASDMRDFPTFLKYWGWKF